MSVVTHAVSIVEILESEPTGARRDGYQKDGLASAHLPKQPPDSIIGTGLDARHPPGEIVIVPTWSIRH